MNALKKIQHARTLLLLDHPFFGVLALQLTLIEDKAQPTAWTDGKSLGFNPAFIEALTTEQVVAIVAHEVMHCAMGHPWRRDARELTRFNIACDLAINPILRDAGLKLPPGVLMSKQFEGKAAEWIYDRLPPSPPQPQGGSSSESGTGLGEVRDAPTGDANAPTEVEWQQTVQQSINAAKAQGKLPSSIARTLGELTKPRVDWRSVLRRCLQDITRSDYAWQIPNRRYMASGLYLPALYSVDCGRLAVAIDTSGSIDNVLLTQFAAEVNAIASELQPSSVDVIWCDAKVHRVDTFYRGEPIEFNPIGGGGTDFRPVFTRLQDDPPVALVYLTDLYGTFPSDAPEYPVVWCATTDQAVPFGEIVPCQ